MRVSPGPPHASSAVVVKNSVKRLVATAPYVITRCLVSPSSWRSRKISSFVRPAPAYSRSNENAVWRSTTVAPALPMGAGTTVAGPPSTGSFHDASTSMRPVLLRWTDSVPLTGVNVCAGDLGAWSGPVKSGRASGWRTAWTSVRTRKGSSIWCCPVAMRASCSLRFWIPAGPGGSASRIHCHIAKRSRSSTSITGLRRAWTMSALRSGTVSTPAASVGAAVPCSTTSRMANAAGHAEGSTIGANVR